MIVRELDSLFAIHDVPTSVKPAFSIFSSRLQERVGSLETAKGEQYTHREEHYVVDYEVQGEPSMVASPAGPPPVSVGGRATARSGL